MYLDLCDPQESGQVARFTGLLEALGAELLDYHASALGVQTWRYQVGESVLHVFVDTWSLDIEAPMELVQQIAEAVHGTK